MLVVYNSPSPSGLIMVIDLAATRLEKCHWKFKIKELLGSDVNMFALPIKLITDSI